MAQKFGSEVAVDGAPTTAMELKGAMEVKVNGKVRRAGRPQGGARGTQAWLAGGRRT